MKLSSLFRFFAIAILGFSYVDARIREGECEVCLKTVKDFITESKGLKEASDVENKIRDVCGKYTNHREKRMCYYIGGTPDAATGMLRELSGPINNSLPAEKICERLKTKDLAICQLSYEKAKEEIDVDKMDMSKARVKTLKEILSGWGEECKGCTAKEDYIRRIQEVKDKHPKKGKATDKKEL